MNRFLSITALTLATCSAHAWDCSVWTSNVPGMECYKAPVPTTSQTQGQGQTQTQGQGQSQSSASNSKANSASTSAANATGGAGGNATVGNTTATGGNQSQTQSANATAGNVGDTQATTVESNYAAARIPVATAYSAALTSGIDTCLGSTSGGAQTGILGVTLGSTRRDKNCEWIKNTHLAAAFSPLAGCVYMLAHVPDMAKAWKDAGITCEMAVIPPPAPAPVAVVAPLPQIIYVDRPAPAASPVVVKAHPAVVKRRKAAAVSPACVMPK